MAAVSQTLTYETIAQTVALDGLDILGTVQDGNDTILLLGPNADFWPLFKRSAEYKDGQPDPIDRWSLSRITQHANLFNAETHFPFGGPPYEPFLSWALDSGRAWSSPVGMLVHDTAGMMISFRGALRLPYKITSPLSPSTSPCETCEHQPCTKACPVEALNDTHFYNTDACHAYLNTPKGQITCMTGGCLARRACPVSQQFNRNLEQSAHHMSYFHTS